MLEDEVKKKIRNYIDGLGNVYSTWYVGITEKPRERLFDEHSVDENNSSWIYQQCFSADSARKIEDYFINGLGTDGGSGGGSDDSDFVYAYKKTIQTNP